MNVQTLRGFSIDKSQKYFLPIVIMPFVDTLNGIFMNQYPIGKVYRIVVFIYLWYLLLRSSKKQFQTCIVCFLLGCIAQVFANFSYGLDNLIDVTKLFTPILMMVAYRLLLKKNYCKPKDIVWVFDIWALAYPLLILIPGILGISTQAYVNEAGWKGFFFALNEISFIESCLVLYLTYRIYNELRVKYLVLWGLNILVIVLMGTKTGYATIALSLILYIIKSLMKIDAKSRKRSVILIVTALLCGGIGFVVFEQQILAIFSRWQFQSSVTSKSLIDFLFSHRTRRIADGLDQFLNGKPWYPYIGWGFATENMINMEMDWIDLLFRTGIIGFSLVLIFYVTYWLKCTKKNSWGMLIVLWMMALSFGAGHVLFYGQSGMMMAMMFILTLCMSCKNVNKSS